MSVISAIGLLLPFTAIAMGAVHPWAFATLEAIAFILIAVWMSCIAAGLSRVAPGGKRLRWLAFIVAGIPALVALQLVPLPPRVLQWISPGSYQLRVDALPGWPTQAAYRWLGQERISRDKDHHVLPSEGEVAKGANIPFSSGDVASVGASLWLPPGAWMPSSIAPRLTKVCLLKILAYCSIGFLLIGYPMVEPEELRAFRRLFKIVLATGLVIGLIGLAEQAMPNGKPLWVFTAYDFRSVYTWQSRAFGSFANPDHLADYLAMVWPFALIGILFPSVLGKVRDRAAVPLLCATVGLVVLAALVATASRGGWLAAAVASLVVFLLAIRRQPMDRPAIFRSGKRTVSMLAVGGGILLCAVLGLFFASETSRSVANQRFGATFEDEGLWQRMGPARRSITMIRDFPTLGVGLGAWPEIYPRYEPPPWYGTFMNATHNDYVQFAAEAGVVGFGLAIAAAALSFFAIKNGMQGLSPSWFPIASACLGALSAIGVHAFLDFPLQIPANALFAVVCFAMLLRICRYRSVAAVDHQITTRSRIAGALLAVLALGAFIATLRQPWTPHPYDLKMPQNLNQSVAQILTYPSNATLHLALLELMDDHFPLSRRLEEARVAVELRPTNPLARDRYAQALAAAGKSNQALSEIQKSVTFVPLADAHLYLSDRLLPWLTSQEHRAIEKGLTLAAFAKYPYAADTLTHFYEVLGWDDAEGSFLLKLAGAEKDREKRSSLLTRAGQAFAKGKDLDKAEKAFNQALALDPDSQDAYRGLVMAVLLPSGQAPRARQIINDAIASSARPAPLLVVLSQIDAANGDVAGAERTLERAASLDPSNVEIISQLATLYYDQHKYERATIWWLKAARLRPQSAQTFFELAQAEENAYQYSAAGRDYKRAMLLEPSNPVYVRYYQDFTQKVAQSADK